MLMSTGLVTVALSVIPPVHAVLNWGETRNLFVFGDSYSTTGWNISAGISLPAPGKTSSNGPNWVMALTERYNVTDTAVYNLAYSGAPIDSNLVTPYLPTIQSLVTQVSLWKEYFSPAPAEVPWTSSDSIFAIWIGINDIVNSWYWTNVTQTGFHTTLLDRMFGQVDVLYQAGARSFVFLSVPPLERTPLYIKQGTQAVTQVKFATLDFNAQLAARISAFITQYNCTSVVNQNGTLGLVKLFDTQKVFHTLLDSADALGFVNVTGYAVPYQVGTATETTQIYPYKPVSSYFWLNGVHPLFTVHDIIAKALCTFIS